MFQKLKQEKLILIFILIFFGLLSSLNFPLNIFFSHLNDDLLFILRGARPIPEKIIFVYLGQEDIQNLGGWPISRDYYAYMIHLMEQRKVRVIGIDILFEQSDPLYTEFDKMLGKFMEETNRVILPMVFEELIVTRDTAEGKEHLTGINPVFPMDELRQKAAGIGFSNLGNAALVRSVPLSVSYHHRDFFSFGAELALAFLGKSQKIDSALQQASSADLHNLIAEIPSRQAGYLRLNHFGNIDDITNYSFLNFLQVLESDTAEETFSNKMVILGVTAAGKSTVISTPLCDALPATLIHATLAENLIDGTYLRNFPLYLAWLVILTLVLSSWLLWQRQNRKTIYIGILLLPVGYLVLTLAIFSYLYITLPLIYPLLAYLSANLYLAGIRRQDRLREVNQVQSLLDEQIQKKEQERQEAQQKLEEYQVQLADREKYSENLLQLAEERKKSILKLEAELRDLQVYMTQPQAGDMPLEFKDIVHTPDSALKEVLDLIQRIRSDDIPVLIVGETGSGKEIMARAIHNSGHRANKPFIAVNCGALTETLLESELFGHEKGSFTGAISRRRGRFELANGGTIFLDEISETSPAFQAKLLRILQEGIFERVGGEQSIKVDVRIIAATNRDIQELVENDQFRSDLYYRLNGFLLKIPALRERKEDIPLLADYFLKKHDYRPVEKFSDRVITALKNYPWPGNVRELENVTRRAAILAKSEQRKIISYSDLPDDVKQLRAGGPSDEIYRPLEDQILEMLRSLEFSHSAISQTARSLGNKDRGTITEYFRGLCFMALTEHDFDITSTAKSLADSSDPKVVKRVEKKISDYLNNLYPLPEAVEFSEDHTSAFPQFKGLPKKYHHHLIQVIKYLQQHNQN